MALFILSCTSTGFAGLAKESYAVEIEQKTSSDIEQLKAEVKKIKELTDQLDSLLKDIAETKKTTKEFQDLVKDLETRVKDMPREAIEELVKVLQKYLDETK
jgi:DNA anti-recombination protein RmuC